jgi:DNA-3-methyladenine glycosylase
MDRELILQNLIRLDQSFFERPVEVVAPDLIGCTLVTQIDGQRAGGIIIETEAYNQEDIFSHCFIGDGEPPSSCAPMFYSAGSVYLYYSSQALCLNISCDARSGFGSAVLIRALTPIDGLEIMRGRRSKLSESRELKDDAKYRKVLTNGPANLCDALGITDDHYKASLVGASVFVDPFELWSPNENRTPIASQRYGLDKQLVRMRNAKMLRAEFPDVEAHRLRDWRWKMT